MEDPVAPASDDADSESMLDAPTAAGNSPAAGNPIADQLDAPTELPGGTSSSGCSILGPGQWVGDYELVREIARGGMGVVYLAKQHELNRFVALKMVLDSDSASAGELERFANEARAAGALDHPGIVPVYEVGKHNGCPYFSMAYVDGKSLASLLVDGPLPPQRAATIAREVSLAISHAHDQQIIHRDIKPANILIDLGGAPRVTDFGVCKSLASHSQLTSHGELIGTPHYMPPEQAGTPDAVIDRASDVYSIGAVLYAMLTARPPFQAPSPIDVIAQVMTKDPVPPSQLLSGIPGDLETITMKCLAKSQSDRYSDARALADDLNRFLNDEPIVAKPPGILKQLQHSIRRHVFLASVSGSFAILLVVLTAITGVALLQARSQVRHLTDLLDAERAGAKRMVIVKSETNVSEHAYDVQRLSDAAERFAEKDPQLAIHLAVYAGRLAKRHQIPASSSLRELLAKFSQQDESADVAARLSIDELIEAAEKNIKRELTDFESTVYGLFDPSHQLVDESKREHSQPTSPATSNEPAS